MDRVGDSVSVSPRRGVRALADSPMAWPCLIVVAAVLLANITYIVGVFDPNPIAQYSNLATSTRAGLLTGQNNIDPNLGFTSQALGHLAALDWLHGHVPWWNPFEGLGTPLAGEMQSAALFPLVLLDVFTNGQVWFRVVLEVVTGLSMLFLLRRLVASRWAATAGAVVVALNGTFAWMFHAPGNPVAFAPMLLLGVEQARQPGNRWLRGWPLIALALALSLYAGFPEVAFIDFLLALLWAAVRASELRGADLVGFVKRLAAGAATGALLAAPILVAFLTYLQHANLVDHGGNGLANAFMDPTVTLPALAMPYVYGPIFAWLSFDRTGTVVVDHWGNIGGYLGASLLVLGLAGLTGRRERRLRIALGLWLVLAIGRTVGMPVAHQVVNAIPGVKSTAFYRYSPPSWTIALCVLAVLAVDDLARHRYRRRALVAGALSLAVVGYLADQSSVLHRAVSKAPDHRYWQYASIAFAVAVIAAVVASASLLRSPRRRAAALGGVLGFEALAMFVIPQFSAPRSAVVDMAPVRYLQAHLGLQRYFTLGPIAPNYGSYWRIATVTQNDVPVVKSYARYVATRLNDNVPPGLFTGSVQQRPAGPSPRQEFLTHFAAYEATGVKYVIQPHGAPPLTVGGAALPVVFSDPLADIVELPRATPFQHAVGGGCTVVTSALDRAVVDCRSPGTLVRLEQYMPGWSATDASRAVTVSPYRSVFQQVPLHAGRNDVSFSFAPPYTPLAVAAATVGLAVLAGGIALRETSRRPPSRARYRPAHLRRPRA